MTIAVVGATGNTGRAVVKELKALGQNPVCVVRNADKAREVLGADAKIASPNWPTSRAGESAARGRKPFRRDRPQSADGRAAEQRARRGAQSRRQISGAGRRRRAVAVADSESVVGRGHAAIEAAAAR